jgi:hypothetical protein
MNDKDKFRWFAKHKILSAILIIVAIPIVLGMYAGAFDAITGNAKPDASVSTSKTTSKPMTTTPKSTPAKTVATTSTPAPAKPKYTTFGDGTFKVGSQIQPGTYRTRTGTSGCYYATLSGFSGNTSDILDNENTDYPAVVTILPSDAGFQSNGCGTWTTDLSQITKSQTTFSDGMFIVGTDIAPGTYQTSGADGCYYARLSGFSGGDGDIIDNENPTGSAIVTVASTDAGFTSQGCGTWTKQ